LVLRREVVVRHRTQVLGFWNALTVAVHLGEPFELVGGQEVLVLLAVRFAQIELRVVGPFVAASVLEDRAEVAQGFFVIFRFVRRTPLGEGFLCGLVAQAIAASTAREAHEHDDEQQRCKRPAGTHEQR